MPHVNCEVGTTAGEDVLAIGRRGNVLHLVRVRDQTHGLVRVTVERQLDQSNDLLGGLVEQVLLAVTETVLIEQF